jgi:hypothetical protein
MNQCPERRRSIRITRGNEGPPAIRRTARAVPMNASLGPSLEDDDSQPGANRYTATGAVRCWRRASAAARHGPFGGVLTFSLALKMLRPRASLRRASRMRCSVAPQSPGRVSPPPGRTRALGHARSCERSDRCCHPARRRSFHVGIPAVARSKSEHCLDPSYQRARGRYYRSFALLQQRCRTPEPALRSGLVLLLSSWFHSKLSPDSGQNPGRKPCSLAPDESSVSRNVSRNDERAGECRRLSAAEHRNGRSRKAQGHTRQRHS